MEILGKADAAAKERSDAYISSEHLLLALAQVGGQAKELLSTLGVEAKHVVEAIAQIRKASGVEHVNDPEGESNLEALSKYGIDLTERAQQGKLDPVIGRDEEIRRCVQVLSRC
jgi:ATP-dependent Clp protease ATP-binding subunit ClpB